MKAPLKTLLGAALLAAAADPALPASVLPAPAQPFTGKVAFAVEDSVPVAPKPAMAPAGAPNILVILLDDVGYGATNTFGGPVHTPELDRLADQGLRYNRFHVCAQCSPTRAALLTGRNDHRAGFGTVNYGGYPGYNLVMKKSTALFADVLRRNGYSTAAIGKWHNTPPWESSPVGPFDRWPTHVGFDYFYGFIGGLDLQWEPTLFRDTVPVDNLPKASQGYQLTTDLANDAIRWIQTHQSLAPQKPWFLYFASGASHEPHQVARKWIDKYRGQFGEGWDALRHRTFERQKQLGLVPQSADISPRPPELPAWASLSADERKVMAREMEVYAGFLEQADYEVGRLVRAVQQGPGGRNTLIIYIPGDNGASSEAGPLGAEDFHFRMSNPAPLSYRLRHLDELGGPGRDNHYSSAWAWALCAPFPWQKLIASHYGGTSDPMIVSWPARIKDRGGLRRQWAHVNDVAATIYDVTGIEFPTRVDGVDQLPLDGVSFAYTFARPDERSRHHRQIFEQWGNRAMYQDGWLAAARHTIPWPQAGPPAHSYAEDRWELYHVDEDFSEAHDLAAQYPEKLKELRDLFDAEAPKNDIYPLGGSTKKTDLPALTDGQTDFVYHASLPRLLPSAAPRFDLSHRITAEVEVPAEGVSGVLISEGSRVGGFVLFAKDNRLVYENNLAVTRDIVTSDIPIPPGHVELAFDFERGEGGGAGTGRLYINGRMVGEARLARLAWVEMAGNGMPGTFSVGRAYSSPVSEAYDLPFKFTGTLDRVRVQLRP